ncbi:uncharacterized protein C10orf143 homolog isoform X3 [Ailuropoda melanoleuca]|uniref:uncharacterized protein C10orf143 homolog isoform X3 n=1 Tax=Ailuropoda melanoleuca TaxID=9646 RepID=UPI001494B3F2|nr:uncharacterized protein C10orf143 homolog isoform X3 [Ailuropoda melanoleuca]
MMTWDRGPVLPRRLWSPPRRLQPPRGQAQAVLAPPPSLIGSHGTRGGRRRGHSGLGRRPPSGGDERPADSGLGPYGHAAAGPVATAEGGGASGSGGRGGHFYGVECLEDCESRGSLFSWFGQVQVLWQLLAGCSALKRACKRVEAAGAEWGCAPAKLSTLVSWTSEGLPHVGIPQNGGRSSAQPCPRCIAGESGHLNHTESQ